MNLSIDKATAADATVVRVEGDLDVYTAPQLRESLSGAVTDGGRLVLDLSAVHFIDSTALGVLATTLQQVEAAKGEFRLVVDDPYLLKIFRITGFDTVFAIFSDLSSALAAN